MGEKDRKQGLVERFKTCPKGAAFGNRQQTVDCDDARLRLDQIGVDERTLVTDWKAMDYRFVGHGFLLRRSDPVSRRRTAASWTFPDQIPNVSGHHPQCRRGGVV
jgi:hypothetical protein